MERLDAARRRKSPSLPRRGSMTKADLVEEISTRVTLSKKDTGIVVNLVLDNISMALSRGDKVELRGFGSFRVKQRRSRRARNPRTGTSVFVPAKLVPFFKASNELKSLVNRAVQAAGTEGADRG
ncbi:MAG: HU family DNA-binding protein [Candidatus Krumholzibacteriia bacterium]|nr:integration host factor subunit beta [Candidatus Latescibacterota bacterium]